MFNVENLRNFPITNSSEFLHNSSFLENWESSKLKFSNLPTSFQIKVLNHLNNEGEREPQY